MKIPSQHRSPRFLGPLRLAAACALALAPTVATAGKPDEPAAGTAKVDQLPKATLEVGNPAPALALKKFVKGEPVKAFEKGKVYVVAFWATESGPSVESISHVTELQKQFPDVTFIGVDQGEPETKVQPFVTEMGDRMNYRVAVDDLDGVAEGATNKAFMLAAAQSSLPTAFVVDKESKIAWIGQPVWLPAVLKRIAAGTFDAEKVAAAAANPMIARAMASMVEQHSEYAGEITPDQIQVAPITQLALGDINPATTIGTVADDTGVYNVSRKDGRRYLKFTGKGGNSFEGYVDTPVEQSQVPAEIMTKIESLLKKSAPGGKSSNK